MSKIGRNEKCPCGSGRKYKQCCLPGNPYVTNTIPEPDPEFFVQAETLVPELGLSHELALARDEFGSSPEFQDILRLWEHMFAEWFWLDRPTEAGPRPIDLLLASKVPLTPARRAWLSELGGGTMKVLECLESKIERPIHLKDLETDRIHLLHGLLPHPDINVGDVFVGRLYLSRQQDMLGPTLLTISPDLKPSFETIARAAGTKSMKRANLCKLLVSTWSSLTELERACETSIIQGVELQFQVLDRELLISILNASRRMKRQPTPVPLWVMVPPSSEKEGILSILLTLDRSELHVYVTPEDRAQKVRRYLERLAPGLLQWESSKRFKPQLQTRIIPSR